jgi:hypothetical protein
MKKADYIVALKGNQGTLRADVEVFVDEQNSDWRATPPKAVDNTVLYLRGGEKLPLPTCGESGCLRKPNQALASTTRFTVIACPPLGLRVWTPRSFYVLATGPVMVVMPLDRRPR